MPSKTTGKGEAVPTTAKKVKLNVPKAKVVTAPAQSDTDESTAATVKSGDHRAKADVGSASPPKVSIAEGGAPKARVAPATAVGEGDDASTKRRAKEASYIVKKPEMLDRILAKTELKKGDVKPVLEAALAVISEALEAGETVHVPPLGKLMVTNSKSVGEGAQVFTLKLRTPKSS